jgi:hypothetical protein
MLARYLNKNVIVLPVLTCCERSQESQEAEAEAEAKANTRKTIVP